MMTKTMQPKRLAQAFAAVAMIENLQMAISLARSSFLMSIEMNDDSEIDNLFNVLGPTFTSAAECLPDMLEGAEELVAETPDAVLKDLTAILKTHHSYDNKVIKMDATGVLKK